MINIDKAIATAVKTGKVLFGANHAIRSAKTGKAKLIVVAENCPSNVKSDIEYYCKLSNVPIIIYKGTSIDLGLLCGKPFVVSALTIRDPGDSDILKILKASEVAEFMEETE
ncbi:50S ribosomal protein L30e [Candidatus Bathyarchaeota archaeon]|nr:MAG: 50S ribosomal protein L30e [Candidatus Bathyarchaeota archaeon]